MSKHIAILVHEHGVFDPGPYFLTEMAAVWRETGLRTSVLHGTASHIEADVIILHVDLTVVPDEYLAFVGKYKVALNANVFDISKRRISANLVRQGDGYDGPVIVKTDRNWGGRREAELAAKGFMPPGFSCSPDNYQIVRAASRVRPDLWLDPELVIEKFQPEIREGCYCLRTWVFLGDKETNSLSYAKTPLVKADYVIRRDVVKEVPDELRQMRRDLGFDYGKFDYVIVDGRVILYDVNRTPALGRIPREQYLPRIQLLAGGIHSYL